MKHVSMSCAVTFLLLTAGYSLLRSPHFSRAQASQTVSPP